MSRERWRKVRRAAGYQVSDRGRVRSVARTLTDGREAGGVVLAPVADKDGDQRVTLAGRTVAVHTLVLEAFAGPAPAGHEACHGNGDRSCNDLSNLRWGTHRENEQDKRKEKEKVDWNGTHRPELIGTSVAGGAAGV